MEKYQTQLLKNIRCQLEKWMDQKENISKQDVYRFLHSISGTAGTIGFAEMMTIAQDLMIQLQEKDKENWTMKEIQEFMIHLIYLTYNQTFVESSEDLNEIYTKEGQPFILVVDDETSMLMYLKEELERYGWIVMAATDSIKAISAFYDMQPDCVIIDVHMQGKNGFELFSFLKEKLKQLFVPTIMISVDDSKDNRLKTFEMGADDFIAKPIDIDELYARVNRHIERKKMVDNLLLTDELTRVYNRKYIKKAYETMCSNLYHRHETFSIAILDLDHFKKVNDHHGHLMGDLVLQKFATFLQNNIRKDDSVIRLGGEEFLLFLQGVSALKGKEILEQLNQEFQMVSFPSNTNTFCCSFSAGIVEVTTNNKPVEKWISLADNALYKAKAAGRKQVRMNESDLAIIYKKTLRVAVIDDDPIICSMLEEMLVKFSKDLPFDIKIKSFCDGALFLTDDWSHSNDRYLVILDGIMPGMDGLDVLQSLRASKRQDQYKVIMLTSRNSEKDIARALQLGADDYMTKPFKMIELQTRIRNVCKRME